MRMSDWSADVCSSDLDVDEIAHLLGKVDGRAPPGDRDLAPGPVGIHGDEQIDGAVAAILVVIALQPSRPGRDWLTCFADELNRAPRSEERRVGKECGRTFRTRWAPYHLKKKTIKPCKTSQ